MMNKKILFSLAMLLSFSQAHASSGADTFPNDSFQADITDKISLQNGAKYFINYCSGCHSLKYQRYNRLFKDLEIDPEIGAQNLIFTSAKAVEQIHTGLNNEEGLKWFGKAPPDLSLTARAKNGTYIYNYLRGFYEDNSRPLGFNNSVFAGASMPNPLWQLQGIQKPIYHEEKHCETVNGKENCETHTNLVGFEAVTKGSLSKPEYDKVAYDITNFLSYVSDPSALDRRRMGPWVLSFLAFLTILFYLLKREYWRDIH
ncbi:MAG: cytochrome c1 [Cardiobacteriaceae bacterium]|nr:cytochrome c1 [Cardiobacteriaceae bacterium]